MAVARLSLKRRSRGRGPCVVAAAAYRHGVALRDERTGRRYEFDRRDDVLWSEVVVPDGVPPFARTLEGLWNAAEAAEVRRDARVGNAVEIGLPACLPLARQAAICRELIREAFAPHGLAADFAIHAGGPDSPNNVHAHFGVTDRPIGPFGFAAAKTRTTNSRGFLPGLRRSAEVAINAHLEAAGATERVSLRSNRDQRLAGLLAVLSAARPGNGIAEGAALWRLGQHGRGEPANSASGGSAVGAPRTGTAAGADRARRAIVAMEEAAARAAGPEASPAELGRARRRARSALGRADAEAPPGTHDPPGQAAVPEAAGEVPAPPPRAKALSSMPKAAATAAAVAGRQPSRGPPGNQRRCGTAPGRPATLELAIAALLDRHAEAAWAHRARAAVAALPPPTPRPMPPRFNAAVLAAKRRGR